ncbi:class I SAM-dependent methyltransferase [Rhizobium sp. Root1220]|uniref:class I SAM-dependent methyltransferase n=1 Tax=Rhizobium sp. Root1220 TaxID=1736432 RepID=UPI0006FF18C0|nr:class I SAM-dependent methyltransferase [Rhizobium sp. Root1220]KQV84055.1 methyltransferase [Rhizobium sp. Root1220]
MTTPEQRLALRKATPRTALDDIHTAQARLLPDRGKLLDHLPKHGIVAELGVAEGAFTADILARNEPERLYLIDPWDMGRYSSGIGVINERFKSEIADGSVVVRQGTSIDMLAQFDDNVFDWVYIDTDHSFALTWQELVLADRKVKTDGRIAGHDFCTGNTVKPVVYGVVEAVNKFCVECGWRFEYLTLEPDAHFSFCLRRI